VGNGSGQVGRNFHDHLTVTAAVFSGEARERVLAALRPWVFRERKQLRAVYSLKLEAAAALRERLAMPPTMAHVTVDEPEESGIGALRAMLRGRQGGLRGGAKLASLPSVLAEGLRLVWEARVKKRRYVSPAAVVRLQVNMAQETPSPSKVGLSKAVDENGLPKAVVDWHVTAGELAALRRFVAYLKERLAAAGVSEGVAWEPALMEQGAAADEALLARLDDARHAMGGACMGIDPQTSVVDPELRVHGVQNLWVASAAVFPDGSAQLPTLTLSALCVRLAERLAQEVA
jgi:choline dehydrogenase-like flavoprotein